MLLPLHPSFELGKIVIPVPAVFLSNADFKIVRQDRVEDYGLPPGLHWPIIQSTVETFIQSGTNPPQGSSGRPLGNALLKFKKW